MKGAFDYHWSTIHTKRMVIMQINVKVIVSSVIHFSASIFGASEHAVLERAVTRERYREHKQLPEWMSCDPDQREQLRPVPTRKLLPSAPGSIRTASVGRRLSSLAQSGKV